MTDKRFVPNPEDDPTRAMKGVATKPANPAEPTKPAVPLNPGRMVDTNPAQGGPSTRRNPEAGKPQNKRRRGRS